MKTSEEKHVSARKRVLFIGNSYTSQIKPCLIHMLANSPHNQTTFEFITKGGATLQQHCSNDSTLQRVKTGNWDFVVLQDHSQISALPGRGEESFYTSVDKLNKLIRSVGAEPVLYMTWGGRDGYEKNRELFPDYDTMQEKISDAYCDAAKKNGITLIAAVGQKEKPTREQNKGEEIMNTFKALFLSLMFTVSILLSACGGGEKDKTAPTNVTPTKVSGVWMMKEKRDVRDCGTTALATADYSATVTQDGNKITVVTPDGTFSGTVNGTTVSWTGEYFDAEDGVWVTITSMSLGFSEKHLSGTSTWEFRNTQAGEVNCSGATQVTGLFDPEGGGNPKLPATPSNLSGIAIAESAIRMNWSDNADNESNYTVEISQEEFGGFTQIASLGVNATSYFASGLSPSTRYFFRVRASNSVDDSAYSNTIKVITMAPTITIPAAPSKLSAIAVENSITLNWTDNAENESFYKVERRQESSTFGFTEIASLGINSTRYVDTNLTRGGRYYYRVRTTNSAGASEYSNTASAVTEVRRMDPPVLSLFKGNTGQLFLKWTHILGVSPKIKQPDNGLHVSVGAIFAAGYGFEVQQSVTSPTSGFVKIWSLDMFTKSIFVHHETPARTRYFRVRAISPRKTEISPWSKVVKVAVSGGENLSGGGGNAVGLIGPGVSVR